MACVWEKTTVSSPHDHPRLQGAVPFYVLLHLPKSLFDFLLDIIYSSYLFACVVDTTVGIKWL